MLTNQQTVKGQRPRLSKYLPNDMDGQAPNNYSYDAIGNLIGDVSEGMDMTWTIYGRVAQRYS